MRPRGEWRDGCRLCHEGRTRRLGLVKPMTPSGSAASAITLARRSHPGSRSPCTMKLRQLQCLCAVVDAGFNISRAAMVLHATQPAVAKQLRLLEEELGAELFVRQATRP